MEGESSLTIVVKTYVFDLDGTLVTLPVDWESLRNRLDSIAGLPGLFRPHGVSQTAEPPPLSETGKGVLHYPDRQTICRTRTIASSC